MHILSVEDFSQEHLDHWFALANRIKRDLPFWRDALKNKLVGTLFFEPSTRTRWSTEAAVIHMGGQILSMESATNSSSSRKGESLRDTLRTVSQYVHCLVVRHPEAKSVQDAAPYSSVPVINAGDGHNEHPTQALLDLFTIRQHFPQLEKVKILFIGDIKGSRTIHSLAKLLRPYNTEIIYAKGEYTLSAYSDNGQITTNIAEHEIPDRITDVDVIYMTRHQAERGLGHPKSEFVLTADLVKTMKEDAIIMHPLPRCEELPPEIDEDHRAVYFEQVENGLWVRMSLIYSAIFESEPNIYQFEKYR